MSEPTVDQVEAARRTAKAWRVASLVLAAVELAPLVSRSAILLAFYLSPIVVAAVVGSAIVNVRAKLLRAKHLDRGDDPPSRALVREAVAETLIAASLLAISAAALFLGFLFGLGHL